MSEYLIGNERWTKNKNVASAYIKGLRATLNDLVHQVDLLIEVSRGHHCDEPYLGDILELLEHAKDLQQAIQKQEKALYETQPS
jgi:hypothetical protein